jgi:hypothetical protein
VGNDFLGVLADPAGAFHTLPDASAVTRALQRTGTYFMPWPHQTSEEFRRFVAQHESGPSFRLSYVREGVNLHVVRGS